MDLKRAVNATDVNPSDIHTTCRVKEYKLGLYSFVGQSSHFFLAATKTDGNIEDHCPAVLVFASLQGQKIIISITQQDLINVLHHSLGTARLGEILEAESKVSAVDDSDYDLTRNSCAHYAQHLWRRLGIQETPGLAVFLIDKILSDGGLVEYAQQTKQHGGLRVLSHLSGDKNAFEQYVKNTVLSQLDIEKSTELNAENYGADLNAHQYDTSSSSPTHGNNIWYETLSNDSNFRSNTHSSARELCESKGKPLCLIYPFCENSLITCAAIYHRQKVS